MNTAAVARVSAEHTQTRRNNSGVQYESISKTHGIDAVVETEPTIQSASLGSLQTIRESETEASSQAKALPRYRLFLWLKKILGGQRIPETEFPGQPTELQRNKIIGDRTIGDSDSIHSENVDTLRAQERDVELQRIERYKMSGM